MWGLADWLWWVLAGVVVIGGGLGVVWAWGWQADRRAERRFRAAVARATAEAEAEDAWEPVPSDPEWRGYA